MGSKLVFVERCGFQVSDDQQNPGPNADTGSKPWCGQAEYHPEPRNKQTEQGGVDPHYQSRQRSIANGRILSTRQSQEVPRRLAIEKLSQVVFDHPDHWAGPDDLHCVEVHTPHRIVRE
ncbi:MAG: hypothetical protein ACXWI1_10840, partial [Croceibacterium sp.]